METSPKPPTQFEPGQKLTVEIVDVAFGGEGVARHAEGLVIFVFFVIPGETVEIELTEVKRNFARAKLLNILTPSPDRAQPECRYYGECGGCQYQHIAYERQLTIKRKQISDLIQRVGGFSGAIIDPVIPCPSPYGYRNRIMIRSQWNKPAQKLDIGFIRYDNRLVVDLDECKIAEPVVSDQIQTVRDNPPPKGGLKVVLRLPPEGWDVPRDSFFQNNFHALPFLVETVRSRVIDAGTRHFVDAYCGVGFFAIECAALVDTYAGIEIDAPAIKSARKNASTRGAANGEFLNGPVEDLLPGLLARFDAQKTTVLIDPPRAGCPKDSLIFLRETGPKQILYVSCHPATLSRDLQILCEGGVYRLERITPVDMFPQTQHVECVADLRLNR